MNTINVRIKSIIEYYKMNVNSFSKHIGIDNNVTIGNIVNTRLNKPSYDVIQKILQTFENISADWLITGKGKMLKEQSFENNPQIPINSVCELCQSKDQVIKIQEKLIKSIEEQLADARKGSDEQKKKSK